MLHRLEKSEVTSYLPCSLYQLAAAVDRGSTISMAAEALQLHAPRPRWRSKGEYLMACLGFAIGMGNVWRFPYLAYQNQGSLLVPYFCRAMDDF